MTKKLVEKAYAYQSRIREYSLFIRAEEKQFKRKSEVHNLSNLMKIFQIVLNLNIIIQSKSKLTILPDLLTLSFPRLLH